MTYEPLHDAEPAEWFATADVDPWAKIDCGPPGFEEYVRVFFINVDERPDFAEPAMPALIDALTPHTGTPEVCFVALWEGYGADTLPPGPTFEIFDDAPHDWPIRKYVLLAAPLARLFVPGTFQPGETLFEEAHALWPADRSWFIAADVDPEWCTVGTTHVVAAELLADPRFETELVPYGTRLTDSGR